MNADSTRCLIEDSDSGLHSVSLFLNERDAIIAGLRLLQLFNAGQLRGMGHHGEDIAEILANSIPLTNENIDELASDLNMEWGA